LLEQSIARNYPNRMSFMEDNIVLDDLFQTSLSGCFIMDKEVEDDSEDSGLSRSMLGRVKEMNIANLTKRHLDVPEAELHLRMEAARKRAKMLAARNEAGTLIETVACDIDTTTSEKFAMKVIPLQLPGPVAKEVVEVDGVQRNVSGADYSVAQSSVVSGVAENKKKDTKHLTREEELELVHIIHEGAKLNSIKAKFEADQGVEITREEWARRSGLSKKDLRRLVSEYREAKSTLVMRNMGLVHSVVKGLYRSTKNGAADVDKELDLIQEGSLGLIRAAELFDPSKGVRFSTYATIWIKGVLSHTHNHQTITVPSREKTKWSKICKVMKQFEIENAGQKITEVELALRCGMAVEQVASTLERMPKAQNILSLDMEYNTHSRSGSSQAKSNGVGLYGDKAFEDDSNLAEMIQMKTDVVATLARNLDLREARLMRLRYGLQDGQVRSITECADAMGISKQRASQLAAGCLKKLREADDAQSLQEYLLTVA